MKTQYRVLFCLLSITAAVVPARLEATVHYVDAAGTSPVSPYISWDQAATNLQAAVDVSAPGDEVVVTNGIYSNGGRAVYSTMTNRVAVDRPINLHSVNGAQVTTIQGSQLTIHGDAVRCVYLTNGAFLSGFTLVQGATRTNGDALKEQSGAGVWCESGAAMVSNCVFSSNVAYQNGGGAFNGTFQECSFTANHAYEGGAVYSTVPSFLNHCTLAFNYASYGAGAWSGWPTNCVLTNCTVTQNTAYTDGGGAWTCTLNNCLVSSNSASLYGGGAEDCVLNNCLVKGNSVTDYGGGVAYGWLTNCTVADNSVSAESGGGVWQSTLANCIVYFNKAPSSANFDPASSLFYCDTIPLPRSGTANISLDPLFVNHFGGNLRLQSNSACINAGSNGSAFGDTDLDGNPRISQGTVDMGAYEFQGPSSPGAPTFLSQPSSQHVIAGTNVTFSASVVGNGVLQYQWQFFGTNLPGANSNTLTFPAVQTNQAGPYKIAVTNEAGWALSTNATLTIDPALAPYFIVPPTNQFAVVGQDISFSATVGGSPPFQYQWAFSGGPISVTSTNATLLLTNVQLSQAGNYTLTVSNIEGSKTSDPGLLSIVTPTVRYVAASGTNPTPPYLSWATAATNIQDAIDTAGNLDIVLVSNGVYASGAVVVESGQTNRVAVTKPLSVGSVNGPGSTFIQGEYATNVGGGIRCVYLVGGASLSGFTLTNGAMWYYPDTNYFWAVGGGVWCAGAAAVVTNCVLTGNSAYWAGGAANGGSFYDCLVTNNYGGGEAGGTGGVVGGFLSNCVVANNSGGGLANCTATRCLIIGNSGLYGGGTSGGSLDNCLVVSNTAGGFGGDGGGAYLTTMTNCTVVGNSAIYAGGLFQSTAVNCIIYYNTASDSSSNQIVSTLLNCCVAPSINSSTFSAPPLFVDFAGGNFRLQSNSPCINAGLNAYVSSPVDLDGRPRIVNGTVDIGAYEFQTNVSPVFIAWLQSYKLPCDGSADFADSDNDGMNNWQEWRTGTDPTNPASVLRLFPPTRVASDVRVTWQSVAGINYLIQRATNVAGSMFFCPVATNVPGQTATTSFTDTNAAASLRLFYRVGVGN
jgi:hypothetical protein